MEVFPSSNIPRYDGWLMDSMGQHTLRNDRHFNTSIRNNGVKEILFLPKSVKIKVSKTTVSKFLLTFI